MRQQGEGGEKVLAVVLRRTARSPNFQAQLVDWGLEPLWPQSGSLLPERYRFTAYTRR